MRYRWWLLFLVALVFVGTGALPRAFNYQGKLTNSIGVGINDTLPITFRLYTSEIGGSPIYERRIPDVVISKGLFSVELSGFPDSVDFSEPYWVEVQVDTVTLAPRQKLSSVPYALSAINTQNAIYSISTPAGERHHGHLILSAEPGVTMSDFGDSIKVIFGCAGAGFSPANLWRSVMYLQFDFAFVSCNPVTRSDSVLVYEVPAGKTLYLYGISLSTSLPWGSTSSLTLRNSYSAVIASELLAADQWSISQTAEKEIYYSIPVAIPGGTRIYNKLSGYFYGTGVCGENRSVSITSSTIIWGYLTP